MMYPRRVWYICTKCRNSTHGFDGCPKSCFECGNKVFVGGYDPYEIRRHMSGDTSGEPDDALSRRRLQEAAERGEKALTTEQVQGELGLDD